MLRRFQESGLCTYPFVILRINDSVSHLPAMYFINLYQCLKPWSMPFFFFSCGFHCIIPDRQFPGSYYSTRSYFLEFQDCVMSCPVSFSILPSFCIQRPVTHSASLTLNNYNKLLRSIPTYYDCFTHADHNLNQISFPYLKFSHNFQFFPVMAQHLASVIFLARFPSPLLQATLEYVL